MHLMSCKVLSDQALMARVRAKKRLIFACHKVGGATLHLSIRSRFRLRFGRRRAMSPRKESHTTSSWFSPRALRAPPVERNENRHAGRPLPPGGYPDRPLAG